MTEFFTESVFFGVTLSLIGYAIGTWLQKRLRHAIFNPLLMSILFVMLALFVLRVDYVNYNQGAQYLSYLLTPATVCFAIPLYEQYQRLRKNAAAILAGAAAGVLASAISVLLLSLLFRLSQEQYISLLPKSITTAIGIALSGELGGVPTLTIAAIVVTGIFGNVTGRFFCRLFRLREPAAVGLAIGAASHAIGTVRAREIGEEEGAISSLAIVVCGLLTVITVPFFAGLY